MKDTVKETTSINVKLLLRQLNVSMACLPCYEYEQHLAYKLRKSMS